MKKSFLLLIVLALLIVPTVFGLQNTFTDFVGNDTDIYFTIVDTNQTSVNPLIGADINFVTTINVTSAGPAAQWNLTGFRFYLPDNSSTTTLTDFKLNNGSTAFVIQNASAFTSAYRNYVTWSMTGEYTNGTNNGTLLTINWSLDSPIAQSKIATVLAGRTYTETWNITSSASNLTIINASLVVTPTYWHTRIGTPSTTFNGTTKNYLASLTDIAVYTNLNISSGTGNLLEYGSGWSTLSIVYDGPTHDSSSGKDSTTTTVVPTDPKKRAGWVLFGLVALVIFAATVLIVTLLLERQSKKNY